MGILHHYWSCWPTLGPFRYPRGAQKGPFGLKQTWTGRKSPERPMTPQECPQHHKTLWLVEHHWYNTFSHTSRPFGLSIGAQRVLIWPQNCPFGPFEDPSMARKGKKESTTLPNSYLGYLYWCDTFLLVFILFGHSQEPLKGRVWPRKGPKMMFLDVFSNWMVQYEL